MNHGRKGRAYFCLSSLVVLGFLCVGPALDPLQGQPSPGKGSPPAAPQNPAAPPPAASSLDQPLAWLLEGRRNFTAVRDYTCTMTKQERVGGVLSREHVISGKFRPQPFSVYMKWLAPKELAGQEVAFVLGRNNNKMRVHSKGIIKGAVGFVSIDVNDPRVMEQSRHTIYQAGIGNVIEEGIKFVESEKQIGKAQVKTGEFTFDNRRCLRLEIIRVERRQASDCYRMVLYLDKDAKLPVRAESYDWPRQGGSPDGDLLELVSYTNLRWNLGLSDREFNK